MGPTEFPIRHTSKAMYLFAALPLATSGFLVYAAQSQGAWLYSIAGVSALIGIALLWMAFNVNHIVVRVSPAGVQLGRRSIPRSALDHERARVVDLGGEYRPVRRTNGVATGELKYGWFVLQNGEKAYVAVNRDEAAYIPTSEGYVLLVGPEDPKKLLETLRA